MSLPDKIKFGVVSCGLSLDEINGLAKTVAENNLGRIKIKCGDSEVIIEGTKQCPPPVMGGMPMMNTAVQVAAPAESAAFAEKPDTAGNVVKSPIVGTYYSSPAPDKPPFVKIGDRVKKGDVIMIIESMKLMNEVKSAFDGKVVEILAENGQTVEYDQPVMVIL